MQSGNSRSGSVDEGETAPSVSFDATVASRVLPLLGLRDAHRLAACSSWCHKESRKRASLALDFRPGEQHERQAPLQRIPARPEPCLHQTECDAGVSSLYAES